MTNAKTRIRNPKSEIAPVVGGAAGHRVLPLVVGLLLPGAPLLQAQSFSLDWFSVDGGGGVSTGGVYSVSGTIGQPDAGMMSGGNFLLQGGFWAGIVVPSTGEVPALFIRWSSDSVIISWSPATAGMLRRSGHL